MPTLYDVGHDYARHRLSKPRGAPLTSAVLGGIRAVADQAGADEPAAQAVTIGVLFATASTSDSR